MIVHTTSDKQTFALGKKLAKQLRGGEVLYLSGDLGSGKTVLVKGLAAGLNIKASVASPTFVIFKPYPVRGHGAITALVHADLYRLAESATVTATGLTEYFGQPGVVTIIEWSDRLPLPKRLPFPVWRINLRAGKNQNHRTITITGLPRQKNG